MAMRNGPMKIAILGAGALGSLFGGLLAESGQAVTLIDIDDAHLDAIRRDGLRLQTDAGDRRIHTLETARPEAAREAPDLLILVTKSLHSAAALAGVRHLLSPHTSVLSLQNGLGNVEAIAAFVPGDRVLVGITTWPADRVGAGHVRSHGEGRVRLMTADGAPRPMLADCVAALAQAGLRCAADPDVWVSIWEKLAFNAALNGICAVTRCTPGDIDALPASRALALRVVGEVVAVARAKGVMADLDRTTATVMHAIAHQRHHKPSMLQDILANRPTEVASIHGAAIAAGAQLGIDMPCTQALCALVEMAETTQRAAADGQGGQR